MQIYFFTAGTDSSELNELESRIRSTVPSLRKIANLNEATRGRPLNTASTNPDQIYIIFPVLAATSFERMANIAEREHRGIFFIFISKEISASDYKRLVRSGGADWVSMEGAPEEILDIISRTSGKEVRSVRDDRDEQVRPAIVAFVPSSGGDGNSTLAIETAVQGKRAKQTRSCRGWLFGLAL